MKVNSECSIRIVSEYRIYPFGTTQLRCVQPAEYLTELGYKTSVDTIYHSVPKPQEIDWLHRASMDRYTKQFVNHARMLGNPIIYDTDDLIFSEDGASYLTEIGNERYRFRFEAYRKAMQACDAVTVSTLFLAERVRKFHPRVYLLRNALSGQYMDWAEQIVQYRSVHSRPEITLAFLYGSTSNARNFQLIEKPLMRLMDEFNNCRLLLVGNIEFSDQFYGFGRRFECHSFMPYDSYAQLFKQIDILMVPLVNESVYQAKSELKYLEAGACAVPVVASPVGVFPEVIQSGVNGLLASDDQWYEQMKTLLVDPGKRSKMGGAARRHVLSQYTSERRAQELEMIMCEVWSARTGCHKVKSVERGISYFKLRALRLFRQYRGLIKKVQKRFVRVEV